MKIHRFFRDFVIWQKYKNVAFPAPKFIQKRLVSFQKHARSIEGSLRILLHTYKMILGRLDPVLSSKEKSVTIPTQASFWRALQYVRNFRTKKGDGRNLWMLEAGSETDEQFFQQKPLNFPTKLGPLSRWVWVIF